MMLRRRFFLVLAAALPACWPGRAGAAVVSSLELADLAGSGKWPAPVQALLRYALSLTKRNLAYRFGSCSPESGGMDCSGTIYHVLGRAGFTGVPRTSREMFDWVKSAGLLTAVKGSPALTDPVLAGLRPGDLLFWTGTHSGAGRAEISHVMIYLGRQKDGRPVVFGASDGRSHRGRRLSGVSVFDFKIPSAGSRASFVGYGPPPGLDIRKLSPVPPADPPARK